MKIFCPNGDTKFMQRDITKQGIKQFILSLNGSEILNFFFFWFREFQSMSSVPNDNFLLSNQDTYWFLL